MRAFQFLGLAVVIVMLVASIRNLARVRARPLMSAFWLLLWLAAGVAISVPDETTSVARLLGIQRGADLLLYCTVLAFFVGFFAVYVRFRQLTREITILTREIALLNAARSAPAAESAHAASRSEVE